jgi:hypothetical protein
MDDVVWQLDEMETERRDPPPVSPAPGILLKKVPPVLEIAEDEKKLAPPPVHDPVQVPPAHNARAPPPGTAGARVVAR